VLSTASGDEECLSKEAKVGPDADESPGGCSNVLVKIDAAGVITAAYNRIVD
jgi:hypothetical protein